MRRRTGITLLEVLIVIAILGLLIGLTLAAIQKSRQAALRASSVNNLRQIILATHQLADSRSSKIDGLTKTTLPKKPLYQENSIFYELLPWTYGKRQFPPPGATQDQIREFSSPTVKVYVSPADPSRGQPQFAELYGAEECSYACNMLVFDGFVNFPFSIPDGTSSTIAYSERYHYCGLYANDSRWGHIFPASSAEGRGETRRATFADRGWHDVLPAKDPATGQTVASVRGRTFQVRPSVADADSQVLQTPFPGGLPVALFDGSVRTLSPGIDESVFWSLVTPNGGEVVGDF
ncbi:MAG TPA: prepilin-type N-terminal cleavage/methylation domain-containing protein [Fimbriiglobus sp.]|nr:prepilin-type N-terminal cleavage/methylation domain-containing protein [Fimbriiglobus sp.]